MALALFAAAFALDSTDAGAFLDLRWRSRSASCWSCDSSASSAGSGIAAANNNRVLVLSAFVVAFAFPFTQNGSDANMSIATQVLIFAATALGLNIVVGLVGLLDLGYIAFLGAGAFTAAILSGLGLRDDRLAPAVPRHGADRGHGRRRCSACSSARRRCGSPATTWPSSRWRSGRSSGSRMNNLDGTDGPNLTNGSERHPRHPRPGLLRVRLRRRAPRHPRRRHRPVRQLLLADAGRDRPDHRGVHEPELLPDRPRLGGDPRGRAGRRGDGRQHLRAEAARLRRRRVPRRRRRRGQGPPRRRR